MRMYWNPWHGCRKISEGCEHCYMYFLDKIRGAVGSRIYKTSAYEYPVKRNRSGVYLVSAGATLWTCMTSDFFLEEADAWRPAVWDMIRERSDVKFWLITKRIARVRECLPPDWGDGWENVILNCTAENQRRADERLSVLLNLPIKHKGISCTPLIGPIDLRAYLTREIDRVSVGGENYDGCRPCDYDWVLSLRDQCRAAGVNFSFFETGTNFIKDGKHYNMPDKIFQRKMAAKSGISFEARDVKYDLRTPLGFPLDESELRRPFFLPRCAGCGCKSLCPGCSECGACGGPSKSKDRAGVR